ncbi:MAG: hypothetical protein ACRYG8_10280 [Janthinobacterium lividum]
MPILSDENLGLMLQELVNRPTILTINGSANPAVLKGLWSALTFYQWTPSIQQGIDAAIQGAMRQPSIASHAKAVAQTRDAMMSDPDFFPFCLSPQYWPDAQRTHFRGLVSQTTYQPPSYWHALGRDVAKVVFPVVLGVGVGIALPEEMVGGAVALAATKVAGKAMTASATKFVAKTALGTTLAGTGTAVANTLSGPSAGDVAHDTEMWRRYRIEAKRRATL